MFVNKSEEKLRESLKFKKLSLFSVHRKVNFTLHLLRRKACKIRLESEVIILTYFVPSNIQGRDSPQFRIQN